MLHESLLNLSASKGSQNSTEFRMNPYWICEHLKLIINEQKSFLEKVDFFRHESLLKFLDNFEHKSFLIFCRLSLFEKIYFWKVYFQAFENCHFVCFLFQDWRDRKKDPRTWKYLIITHCFNNKTCGNWGVIIKEFW